MARINYTGIVESITGKLGGTVFQKNLSGFIIRARGAVLKQRTTKQQNAIADLLFYLGQYQQATIEEKISWNEFAALHTRVNPYGRIVKLNGVNWFCSINKNRSLCGVGNTLTPPAYTLPDEMPTFTTILELDNFMCSYVGNVSNTSQFLLVYSTNVLKRNNTSFKRYLMYQEAIQLYNNNSFDLYTKWAQVHDLDLNNMVIDSNSCIGFRFVMCHRNTGLTGPVLDFTVGFTL